MFSTTSVSNAATISDFLTFAMSAIMAPGISDRGLDPFLNYQLLLPCAISELLDFKMIYSSFMVSDPSAAQAMPYNFKSLQTNVYLTIQCTLI